MKFCYQDILKTIKAWCFKLNKVRENTKKITLRKFEEKNLSSYSLLQLWALKTCIKDKKFCNKKKSKSITATRSFKLGQLIEEDE